MAGVKRLLNLAIVVTVLGAGLQFAPALGSGAPNGSYRESCSNIGVHGTTLEAYCRNARGWPVRASLARYDQCRSDIENNDGRLQCGQVPSGSYRQTCNQIVVDGAVLKAVCADRKGRGVSASLVNFNRCGTIDNDNGKLVCIGSSAPGIPSGSFRATCRDVAVGGGTLYATCQTARGAWVPTSLSEYRRCANDIYNNDGRLKC
jgi:CVNH domain